MSTLVKRDREMPSPRESYPVNEKTFILVSFHTDGVFHCIKQRISTGERIFLQIPHEKTAYHTYRRDRHSVLFEAGEQGSFQRVDEELLASGQH